MSPNPRHRLNAETVFQAPLSFAAPTLQYTNACH